MSGLQIGKTVVVGATGAIGEPVARRLAAEGHDLVLAARNSARLTALATDLDCAACPVDVVDESSVATLRDTCGPGVLRMLVHLPAAPTAGGILEAPVTQILGAVDVKVGGLLRLVRALLPALGDGTRLVVVAGNLAFDPIPDAATSGIANAALANATRQLQRALGPRGVTAHVVAPGPVLTPRWESIATAEAHRRGIDYSEIVAEATAASPLGRLTTVDEVSWAVARLADPEAGALAGSTLLLDAGRRTAIP